MRALARVLRREGGGDTNSVITDFSLQQQAESSDPASRQQVPISQTSTSRMATSKIASNYGLITLYEPSESTDAPVDIVFVHGLTGNSHDTWLHHESQVHWPTKLLCADIKDARILVFGYDADVLNFWKPVSQNSSANHAENLLGALVRRRERSSSVDRSILFVAHSLGGLIVKKALSLSKASAESHLQQVWKLTTGIVFMGTPHHGADLAAWAKTGSQLMNVLKKTNKDIVAVLKPDSEVLASIQQDFGNLLRNRQQGRTAINITCFFEELPVEVVGEIVPKNSAIMAGYASYGIHANHMDMTKFRDTADPGYEAVLGELLRWIKALRTDASHSRVNDEESGCLRSLHFEGLVDRQDKVSQALDDTFEWIWTKSELGFGDWLRNGPGPFWITGKPGSGKSTLTKSIAGDQRLFQGLTLAEPTKAVRNLSCPPIVASFFFDFNSSALSNSLPGMLRSLLWQILKQRPAFFPSILATYQSKWVSESSLAWTQSELEASLRKVLQQRRSYKICIFIDALDEYGNDVEIYELLQKLFGASFNACHLCVASRSSPDFSYQFNGYPTIRIEGESSDDIMTYAVSRLRQSISANDFPYVGLASSIAAKANGLFLWAKLVINDIIRGRRRHESLEQLRARLNCLPRDLAPLYGRILQDMDAEDRAEVLLCLSLVLCAKKLTAAEVCYAISKTDDDDISTDDPRSTQRLKAIGGGLLEIEFDQKSKLNLVALCHETVAGFVFNPHHGYFESKATAELMAHECLLKACIRRIRGNDTIVNPIEWCQQNMNCDKRDAMDKRSREKRAFFEYAIRNWVQHAKTLEMASDHSQAHILKLLCGKPSHRWFTACQMAVVAGFPLVIPGSDYHNNSYHPAIEAKNALIHENESSIDILLWVLLDNGMISTVTDLLGLRDQNDRIVLPLGGLEEMLQTVERNGLQIAIVPQGANTPRSKTLFLRYIFRKALQIRDMRLIQFFIVHYDHLQIPVDNIESIFKRLGIGNVTSYRLPPGCPQSTNFFFLVFCCLVLGIDADPTSCGMSPWIHGPPYPMEIVKELTSSRHFMINGVGSPRVPLEIVFVHFISVEKSGRPQPWQAQDILIAIAQVLLDQGAVADPYVRARARKHERLWALVKDLPQTTFSQTGESTHKAKASEGEVETVLEDIRT